MLTERKSGVGGIVSSGIFIPTDSTKRFGAATVTDSNSGARSSNIGRDTVYPSLLFP
jgi:hypothetical protein